MAAGATIGALKFVLGADTAEFQKRMREAETTLKKVAVVGSAIGTVIGNALVAAFRGLSHAIRGAIDEADKLDEMSQKIGISVEQLSAFQFAAKMSGVQAEAFGSAIVKLSRAMTDAASDTSGQLARTFQTIGVSATDAAGQLRPTADVLLDLANKFQGWTDGAGKAAIATALFGRAGADLIPFLNQGKGGIEALMKEAQRLGIVLDAETAAKAGKLNDTMDKIKAVFDGFIRQILVPLLPQLQLAAEMFSRWTQESMALKVAIEVVAAIFKVLMTAIAIVNNEIQQALIWLSAVAKAFTALKNFDWAGIATAFKTAMADSDAEAKKLEQTLRNIWANANGIQGAVGKLGVGAATVLPPVIASTRSISDAMRSAKDEARAALDTIINSPTETYVNKMAAIKAALDAGTISQRQFGDMTRRVTKENQGHMFDLASATATALTTIFGKSKAAGIAAAIINTAVGITKALATLPPPFSFAQAALVAAMGAAQIATIRGTSQSGAGAAPSVSGGGGGGGEESGPAAAPQMLMVQGISNDALFSGEAVRNLAQKLIDFQKDGGQVIIQ
jgi:minor tail protein